MHVRFIKTHAGFSASYQVIKDGSVIYRAEIPMNFRSCHAAFYHNDSQKYALCFDSVEQVKNFIRDRASVKLLPFTIWTADGALAGYAFQKRSKALFGYLYYAFSLNERAYTAYEIGMGKEGVKIPIFEGDKQIALIEKGTAVYNNKDEYDIYTADGFAVETAALFNLYYDFVRFGRYGEAAYKSKEVNYTYTINKILKSKYDPAFKERYIG